MVTDINLPRTSNIYLKTRLGHGPPEADSKLLSPESVTYQRNKSLLDTKWKLQGVQSRLMHGYDWYISFLTLGV